MKFVFPKIMLMGMLLASAMPILASDKASNSSSSSSNSSSWNGFSDKVQGAMAVAIGAALINKSLEGVIYLSKWYFSKPEPKPEPRNPLDIMLENYEEKLRIETEKLRNLTIVTEFVCKGADSEKCAKFKDDLANRMKIYHENQESLDNLKNLIAQHMAGGAPRLNSGQADRTEPVTLADSMRAPAAVDLSKAAA